MLNIIMLNVANKPSMLNGIMLIVIMLNVIMLNVIMLNFLMLSVTILNVMVPLDVRGCHKYKRLT